ncbi:MAG TPA: hypothetical protein PK230_09125, partial [Chitinophagales bacterium]|nr:hypothetical protein [Chitinophagales bacterium]
MQHHFGKSQYYLILPLFAKVSGLWGEYRFYKAKLPMHAGLIILIFFNRISNTLRYLSVDSL